MLKTVLPANAEELHNALGFIEDALNKRHFSRKSVNEALLLSEESMLKLFEKAPEDAKMRITVRYHIGIADITVSMRGTEKAEVFSEYTLSPAEEDSLGYANEETVRKILLSSYSENLKYGRKGSYNFVKIIAGNPRRTTAFRSLAALFIAAVIGIVLRLLLSGAAQTVLNTYLFTPVQTAFFNSLKLLVAPTVFFSIITSVARYSSMSNIGRINVKVIVGYAVTSLVAIFVGYGIFRFVDPGIAGQLSEFAPETAAFSVNGSTVLDTVVNIIPDNVISPFLEMNTPQLIFLALIFGVALGKVENYSESLRKASASLEMLCTKVTELLSKVVPYVVFLSTVFLVMNVGGGILLSVAEMLLTLLAALVTMALFYGLVLLFVGVNPVTFIKKYARTMWGTFNKGSGVAALPRTIRCCKNTLGVSPEVYSFSIPFGAMVNMDGNCIYLVISGLFLAKLCGADFMGNEIIPLVFTVFMLSIGAPISSGSVLLCLTVLLGQMGISVSALSVLIGINLIAEMLLGMSDTLGDVATTLAIAKTEKYLDTAVFNSKRGDKKQKADT